MTGAWKKCRGAEKAPLPGPIVVWPPRRQVRAALLGEKSWTFRVESGKVVRGLKCSIPWVYWSGVVVCERCGRAEEGPPATTKAKAQAPARYATQLTDQLLYPFAREHRWCPPRKGEQKQEVLG